MPVLTVALATLLAVFASNSIANAQEKSPLNEHHVLAPIRVFYTNEGQSAVSQDDVDQNPTKKPRCHASLRQPNWEDLKQESWNAAPGQTHD
jgi:hypothetical protein